MKLLIFLVVALVVLGGFFIFKLSNKTNLGESSTPSSSPTPSATASVSNTPINQNMIKATIVTARGNIELELYPKVAPKTVMNFINLSKEKFYDGTKFHRVIADFMIQGGDPFSKTDDPRVGTGGPDYRFQDEINPRALGVLEAIIKQLEAAGYVYDYSLKSMKVDVGTIAMANAGPNTNGSQFFIVTTSPQPHLNGRHTVFGKVTKGMDVVRAIKQGDIVKTI